MKTIKKARKISSPLISGIMGELTPVEKAQTAVKMRLAAKLGDLIKQQGWSKGHFADRVGKHPSEITKWLSGTHNFTTDTLSEIAVTLGVTVDVFFASERGDEVSSTHLVVSARTKALSIGTWTIGHGGVDVGTKSTPARYYGGGLGVETELAKP